MVRAARDISCSRWSAGRRARSAPFLADYARGHREAAAASTTRKAISATGRAELDAIAAKPIPQHPLGHYLIDSARSWATGGADVRIAGHGRVPPYSHGTLRRARRGAAGQRAHHARGRPALHRHRRRARQRAAAADEQVQISATALRLQLQGDLDDYFNRRVIERRARSRPDRQGRGRRHPHPPARRAPHFSDYDRHQLLHHEALRAFAHRAQRPRTTAAAEPVAVLAAQPPRPRKAWPRSPSRSPAASTSAHEAHQPAHRGGGAGAGRRRLHRGVPLLPRCRAGRRRKASPPPSACSAACPPPAAHAFTKDTVYLRGLIGVHTFFRWALQQASCRCAASCSPAR